MKQDCEDEMTSATGATTEKRDFAGLEQSGEKPGASWVIGSAFVRLRNWGATGLVRLGVRPNMITTTGCLATIVAGACLAVGASHTIDAVEGVPTSWWCLVGFCCLVAAGACDMLDGAVARIGGFGTRFGQIYDSTLDRFSDCALYLGVIVHFALIGNVTICALAGLAMIHTYSISYVKARADGVIAAGTVGWWQRPERIFGFLVAMALGHLPALMWQQAILPGLTVMQRLLHARSAIIADDNGRPLPSDGPAEGTWRYLLPWRHPRGSFPYDVCAAVNISWIVVAPWIWPFFYGRSDPLRNLMEAWLG
jgi:phosphatidylglycerophosphate synthase